MAKATDAKFSHVSQFTPSLATQEKMVRQKEELGLRGGRYKPRAAFPRLPAARPTGRPTNRNRVGIECLSQKAARAETITQIMIRLVPRVCRPVIFAHNTASESDENKKKGEYSGRRAFPASMESIWSTRQSPSSI